MRYNQARVVSGASPRRTRNRFVAAALAVTLSTSALADCLDDAAAYWGVPPLLARAIAYQQPAAAMSAFRQPGGIAPSARTPAKPSQRVGPAMAAIEQCGNGVDSQLFASLVKQESNYNPYAIGMDGKDALKPQPQSYEEAVAVADRLVSEGKKFSVGLGQVHISNVQRYGLTWEQAFDPCTNLRVASKILRAFHSKAIKSGYASEDALFAALRGYNSGNVHFRGSDGYARNILGRINAATASIGEGAFSAEPESASTRYIGIMHVSSSWLPTLKRYGVTEKDLHDGCTNAYVGSWILAQKIKQYGYNWTAVGAYSAADPARSEAYAQQVLLQLIELQ